MLPRHPQTDFRARADANIPLGDKQVRQIDEQLLLQLM